MHVGSKQRYWSATKHPKHPGGFYKRFFNTRFEWNSILLGGDLKGIAHVSHLGCFHKQLRWCRDAHLYKSGVFKNGVSPFFILSNEKAYSVSNRKGKKLCTSPFNKYLHGINMEWKLQSVQCSGKVVRHKHILKSVWGSVFWDTWRVILGCWKNVNISCRISSFCTQ